MMFVNDSALQKANEPDSLLVFFHTQRTGGSNLQRWFRTHFSDDEVYSSRTVDDYVHWQKLHETGFLADYKLVAGFAEFRDWGIGRPVVYTGTIRHPFYRVVSLYQMSRRHTGHFLHDVAREGTFEEFYGEGAERNPVYFHNLMTRRLGGWDPKSDYKADVGLAKRNMEAKFGMVMPTNHLHEATEVLVGELDWSIPPIKNTGGAPDSEKYADYEASPAKETILEHNQLDLELYEYVTNS